MKSLALWCFCLPVLLVFGCQEPNQGAGLPDEVSLARADLTIGYGSGDGASHVTQNLQLTLSGSGGVAVSWASDSPCVGSDGAVVRPLAGAGAQAVTLTATLVKGTASATKKFSVVVLALPAEGSSLEFGRSQDQDRAVRADAPGGGFLFSAWTKVLEPVLTADGSWTAQPYPSSDPLQPARYWNTDFMILNGTNWFIRFLTGNSSYRASDQTLWYNANSMVFPIIPGTSSTQWSYLGDFSFYGGNPHIPEADARSWVWVAWQTVIDTEAQTFTLRQWLKFGPDRPVIGPQEDVLTFARIREILKRDDPDRWPDTVLAAWVPGPAVSFQVGKDRGYLTRARVESRSTEPTLAELDALAAQTSADAAAWAWYPLVWRHGAPDLDDESGHNRPLSLVPGAVLYQGPPGP